MTSRTTAAVNDVAYQAGWFAAVVGAALGHGTAGAAIAAVLIALHLWLTRKRRVELRLLVLATLLFGALGGPVAFLAGERLGAVELTAHLRSG